MPTHARDRLLQAAQELFFAEGIRAVGVERLLSVSGVGRASFYRHFASKDELVTAVLKGRDASWREWLAGAVAARGNDPLAVFDALAAESGDGDFRGCAFINAVSEIADADSPVRRIAAEHKRAVTDFIAGLLAAAGHRESRALAGQFVLLMDGATVTAARERSTEPLLRAKEIARALLG
ncbi:TetR/AcrR family transcriptional regulator [Streptomyces stramineus]|uniref:TetR/AcrR family transcriptional regulator n=1 Tax=Streptomyces stramineus TaxID=173861 RepID=A0ABP3KPR8_9ACTN